MHATKNILINSSHVIAGSNNSKYVYKFQTPETFTDHAIALNTLNCYYSWYNINSSLYNNNVFQYKWFDNSGALNTTKTVTIPDGFYSINSINLYLQSVMLANGHYLYDTVAKKNIFFIEFISNPTYYAFQLNMTPMYASGSVPATITKAGSWAYPTSQRTAQVIINSTNNFKQLIGFDAGTYPSGTVTTLFQQLSQNTPVISPCTSLVIRCNLVRNDLANPNDVLYSFTQGNSNFGDLLDERPSTVYYSPVQNGTYNEIVLTFLDQNFNPVHIKDSQMLITIMIK